MKWWMLLGITIVVLGSLKAQDSIGIDAAIAPSMVTTVIQPTIYCINEPAVNRLSTWKEPNNSIQLFFWLLLGLGIVLVVILSVARLYVNNLVKSAWNLNYSSQMARSERSNDKIYAYLLLVVFVILLTLGIYLAYPKMASGKLGWWLIAVVLSVYFLLDMLQTNLAGALLQIRGVAMMANYHLLAQIGSLTYLVFPLVALLIFGPNSMQIFFAYLFIGFLLAALVLKDLRFIQIMLQERIGIHKFYFFLYICTFKFLPIVMIAKFILNNSVII